MPQRLIFKLTASETNRIYCCLMECPYCEAKRGEYCKGSNGKIWKSGHHYMRTPFGRYAKLRELKLLKAYNKLVKQIMDSYEVIGHE